MQYYGIQKMYYDGPQAIHNYHGQQMQNYHGQQMKNYHGQPMQNYHNPMHIYGHGANHGGPQPILQDQPMYNYGTNMQPKIRYTGKWGKEAKDKFGKQIKRDFSGDANHFMNPNYPPWYDHKNPKKGPWD